MRISRRSNWKGVRPFALALLLLGSFTGTLLAQTNPPSLVSSRGYINGTPLATHTTATFDTRGASTLVAFVSTNPSWNGQPVSISGLTDSAGNAWQILTGPTAFTGNALALVSAIYFVTNPVTSDVHAVTATLTNPAPLVMHVFAVSGSDLSATPIYSAINDPSPRLAWSTVDSAPITVPANSLLLSWAKNDATATTIALGGFTLDAESTSFLWAESQIAVTAGSYAGHFDFSTEVGWQSAIVGISPSSAPVAYNTSITAAFQSATAVTLTGASSISAPLTYSVTSGPSHGTLTGTAPNLTYTPAAGYIGADSLTFRANDGSSDSNVATISITVRGPNHAPVASDSSVVVAGHAGVVPLNASDVDGDPLTFTIVTPPAHGQLSVASGSNRTYTPTPGFTGADSFTFQASDSQDVSNVATVVVGVETIAPPPSIVGSRGYVGTDPLAAHTTTSLDTRGASTLVAYVSTHPVWNNLPVSISNIADTAGNTWNLLTGPVTYQGTSFTLMSAIYYVTAPVTSANYSLTVNLTNAAPLVVHFFAVTGTDITTVPTYSPITDPGPNNPMVGVTSAPISVPDNTLVLGWVKNDSAATPSAANGFTLDTQSVPFLWGESETVSSAGSYSGSFLYDTPIVWQTAVVGLSPSAGPLAFGQAVAVDENGAAAITLSANSPIGAPLTYAIVSGTSTGTLTGVAPDVTYTPANGYVGADAFSFTADDGTGTSGAATVSITVRGPNHAPVAADGSATIAGGSGVVALSAADADNDPLTYTIVTPPAHGVLSAGTGANRTFAPAAGFTGADSFTFKANDGHVDSNVATVTLTVQAVAPIPSIVSSNGYINGTPLATHTSTAFDTRGASTLVAFVSTNPEWNGQPVGISSLTDSVGNTWNLLTGPTTSTGVDFQLTSAMYYVNVPATSATYSLSVNLTNPAPLVFHVFAVSGADPTSTPIYSAITDPGAGVAAAEVTSAPITVAPNTLLLAWVKNDTAATAAAIGGYTLDAQSTSFLWAESEPVAPAGTYSGDFEYSAPIAWQTAMVGLQAPGAPVALGQSVATDEGTAVAITLSAVSGSGTSLTYTISTMPAHGTLSGTAPNLLYTPTAGFAGADAFTFAVDDGSRTSNTATVNITVRAVNHAPVASDGSATIAGGSGPVSLAATDADHDALTYMIVTAPAHGQVSAGTGSSRTYTAAAGFSGSDSFTFQVSDGHTLSNVATVSVMVQNDGLQKDGPFVWFSTDPGTRGSVAGDFDGDGRADFAVFRPSDATWYVLLSSTNYQQSLAIGWGSNRTGDIPVPADYDGDGKVDLAVWRPANATWYVLTSTSHYTQSFAISWGSNQANDILVPADYDGDGKADIAVWRPGNATWYILTSSSNYTQSVAYAWGASTGGDVPVPADYDGDGKADLAIWRPADATWYIAKSNSNYASTMAIRWGSALTTDVPAVGDYDGDGKADVAVWRLDNSTWYILTSSSNYTQSMAVMWGASSAGDVPVAADYDGDGKTDIAVWRPGNSTWYILTSSSGYVQSKAVSWGSASASDVPLVPGRLVHY